MEGTPAVDRVVGILLVECVAPVDLDTVVALAPVVDMVVAPVAVPGRVVVVALVVDPVVYSSPSPLP